MTRHFLLICVAISMLFAGACKRQATETYLPDEGSVALDLEAPPKSIEGTLHLICNYTSQGKTARFRIELGPAQAVADKDAHALEMEFGNGRFVADPRSDSSALLADLKKALEAKVTPTKVQRAIELPFTYVRLGKNMSQAQGGGFSDHPSGNWTTTKIFIEQRSDEGEVFFNYNPLIRKAQFSIKDTDYADFLLAQLAKVL